MTRIRDSAAILNLDRHPGAGRISHEGTISYHATDFLRLYLNPPLAMTLINTRQFFITCLIAAGWVLSGTALHAQSFDDVEVHYGVKGGVVLSDIQSDQTGGSGRRQGLVAGGFVSVGLPESFSLQGEALYVQRGDKQEFLQEGRIEKGIMRLDYLDIPLFVKLEAPLLGDASMFPYMGPGISIKLRENTDELLQLPENAVLLEDELRSQLSQVSLAGTSGVVFSAGVEFNIEGPAFDILADVRFSRTVGDIGDQALTEDDIKRNLEDKYGGVQEFQDRLPDDFSLSTFLRNVGANGFSLRNAQNNSFSVMIGVRF